MQQTLSDLRCSSAKVGGVSQEMQITDFREEEEGKQKKNAPPTKCPRRDGGANFVAHFLMTLV